MHTKAEESSVFAQSWRGCLCAHASDVCALQMCVCASDVCTWNLSHSARLLLQQSWASFILASCLRAVLISSPDTWDWTRMHTLVVMHRRTLCENVDSAKIKVPFYKYRYFTRGIDASYRHTLYQYIDPYWWIVTPLVVCRKCSKMFKIGHHTLVLLVHLLVLVVSEVHIWPLEKEKQQRKIFLCSFKKSLMLTEAALNFQHRYSSL